MYDKERVTKEIFQIIEREKLCFFDEIQLFVAPTKSTLCDWELLQSDEIIAGLDKNKVAS
jgi:hypothetical protein